MRAAESYIASDIAATPVIALNGARTIWPEGRLRLWPASVEDCRRRMAVGVCDGLALRCVIKFLGRGAYTCQPIPIRCHRITDK